LTRSFFPRLGRGLGIDLGTASTLVYVPGRGIVINQPSVVTIERASRRVVSVGAEARAMLGRTPKDLEAIRPLQDGVIADFDLTEEMLRQFITRARGTHWFFRPWVVIGAPSGVTGVERRAVRDAALRAGAGEAILMEEPLAGAWGAKLPVDTSRASMIVDLGGGTTEVAVITLNGIALCRSLRVAGDELDAAIVTHLRREHNVLIGERRAEEIKLAIGSAYPLRDDDQFALARGRDLVSGLPKAVRISAAEVRNAMKEPVRTIVEAVKWTLEETLPELASDIAESGITLVGGGSLLRGLDLLLQKETGLPVQVAHDPITCVARGAGMAVEQPEALHLLTGQNGRK